MSILIASAEVDSLNTLRLSADDVFIETAYSVPFAHPDLELPDGNGAVERSPVYVQFINANAIGTSQAIAMRSRVVIVQRCPHRASEAALLRLSTTRVVEVPKDPPSEESGGNALQRQPRLVGHGL